MFVTARTAHYRTAGSLEDALASRKHYPKVEFQVMFKGAVHHEKAIRTA